MATVTPAVASSYTVLEQTEDIVEEARLLGATAVSGGAGSQLGASIAMDGDWAIVGAPGFNGHGAATLLQRDGASWVVEARFEGDARADRLGAAVAIAGDTLLIGAPGVDHVNRNEGAVAVYELDPRDLMWRKSATLLADDAVSGALFGRSVALSPAGDEALVGAPGHTVNGPESGQAYRFQRGTDGTWTLVDTFSGDTEGDLFGSAVAHLGTTLATGAPGAAGAGDNIGAAYLYADDGNQWTRIQTLQPTAAGEGAAFGAAVAGDSTNVLVGAANASDTVARAGGAYLYQLDVDTWALQTTFVDPGGAVRDRFGYSVAIQDDRLVIGAPGDDDSASAAGAFFQATRDPGTGNWSALSKTAFGAAADRSGSGVAVFGDQILIGSPGADAGAVNAGAVHAYDCSNGCSVNATILADSGNHGDHLGFAVSLSGDRALVGSPSDDSGGVDGGLAVIYLRDANSGFWLEETSFAGAAGDRLGFAVDLEGDRAIVGAPGNDTNGDASGSVTIYSLAGGIWSEEASLALGAPQPGDEFGAAVGLDGGSAIVGAPGRDGLIGMDEGVAAVFDESGGNWSLTSELSALAGVAGSRLGAAVSLDGDLAVVGAPGRSAGSSLGFPDGATYVFEDLTIGGWQQTAQLLAVDAGDSAGFGCSVDVAGDRMVVGACAGHNGAGAVQAFERVAMVWTPGSRLLGQGGGFGAALAINGDQLLVGAPAEGLATLFDRQGSDWVTVDSFTAPQAGQLGAAVDLDTTRALLGAPATGGGGLAVIHRLDHSPPSMLTIMPSATSILEGQSLTVSATFETAALLEDLVATATFGDGSSSNCALSGAAGGALREVTADCGQHTYIDDPFGADDSYLLTVSVTDDVTRVEATETISVSNEAPSVTLDAVGNLQEGSTLSLEVMASDAGGDQLTISLDCDNDGMPEAGPGSLSQADCLFVDDGEFTASAMVTDEDFASTTETLGLSIANVAPTATDDAAAVDQGQTAMGALLANDTDPGADTLTVSAVSGDPGLVGLAFSPAQGGSIAVDATGDFTFEAQSAFDQLDDGESTMVVVDYEVSDGDGGSDSGVLTVTVNGMNDAPQAFDDSFELTEDETLHIAPAAGLLANDTDIDAETLTVQSVGSNPVDTTISPAEGGDLLVNGSGGFSYATQGMFETLDDGESVVINLNYEMSDGDETDAATMTLRINGANDAPVAADDQYVLLQDETLNVAAPEGLLANDSDIDDEALVIANPGVRAASGVGGTVTIIADGSFEYVPPAATAGVAEVTYQVSDGTESSGATATFVIGNVNRPPLATLDILPAISEDSPALEIDVADLLANDSPGLGETEAISVIEVSNALGGSVQLAGLMVTFTPLADYFGPAGFDYRIEDAIGQTSEASASMNITPVNDPPSFSSHSNLTYDALTRDVTVTDFVSDVRLGPDNESDQAILAFEVAITDASGIIDSATVTPAGVLDLELTGTGGTAELSVVLRDSGGGDDRSAEQLTTIVVGQSADLDVAIVVVSFDPIQGGTAIVDVAISNDGPDAVVGAAVTINASALLTAVTWTCSSDSGGTCQASGSGAINDQIDLAADASLTYRLSGTIGGSTGEVTITAAAATPTGVSDVDPSNNDDLNVLELPVWTDGFESGVAAFR